MRPALFFPGARAPSPALLTRVAPSFCCLASAFSLSRDMRLGTIAARALNPCLLARDPTKALTVSRKTDAASA